MLKNLYLIPVLVFGVSITCAATTIQFKRGLESALPATAAMGEPLFTTDTNRMFVGTTTGKVELPVKGRNTAFNNISANSISVPQQLDEQAITLFEAAANGNNIVTIKPMANMSSNRVITIGNHGLYVNGVQKLEW
jgi:hypothetical protein